MKLGICVQSCPSLFQLKSRRNKFKYIRVKKILHMTSDILKVKLTILFFLWVIVQKYCQESAKIHSSIKYIYIYWRAGRHFLVFRILLKNGALDKSWSLIFQNFDFIWQVSEMEITRHQKRWDVCNVGLAHRFGIHWSVLVLLITFAVAAQRKALTWPYNKSLLKLHNKPLENL